MLSTVSVMTIVWTIWANAFPYNSNMLSSLLSSLSDWRVSIALAFTGFFHYYHCHCHCNYNQYNNNNNNNNNNNYFYHIIIIIIIIIIRYLYNSMDIIHRTKCFKSTISIRHHPDLHPRADLCLHFCLYLFT